MKREFTDSLSGASEYHLEKFKNRLKELELLDHDIGLIDRMIRNKYNLLDTPGYSEDDVKNLQCKRRNLLDYQQIVQQEIIKRNAVTEMSQEVFDEIDDEMRRLFE